MCFIFILSIVLSFYPCNIPSNFSGSQITPPSTNLVIFGRKLEWSLLYSSIWKRNMNDGGGVCVIHWLIRGLIPFLHCFIFFSLTYIWLCSLFFCSFGGCWHVCGWLADYGSEPSRCGTLCADNQLTTLPQPTTKLFNRQPDKHIFEWLGGKTSPWGFEKSTAFLLSLPKNKLGFKVFCFRSAASP